MLKTRILIHAKLPIFISSRKFIHAKISMVTVYKALLETQRLEHSRHPGISPEMTCWYVINESISLSSSKSYRRAEMSRSKLHKEVTEIKVYWFVCLNTFKFAKSKNGLFET